MTTKQALLEELRKHVGITQFSNAHRKIIDDYNRIRPLPVGYRVTYHDDWCDIFVTYIADRVGLSKQIGRECGVQRHLNLLKQKGLWVGKVTPQVGDIIFFDWDGGGFCDHIGYVESVSGHQVVTIEGNANRQVSRCYHLINSSKIVGYARPNYQESMGTLSPSPMIVREVIRGLWGNGQERVRRLSAAGYNAHQIQQAVNDIMRAS